MKLDKRDYIFMLEGIGVPYGGYEDLSRFTGNQWNEAWSWNHYELLKMSEKELEDLYIKLKRGLA